MLVTNSLQLKEQIKKKSAVALGSFDALHQGHIKVIERMIEFANENNLLPLVQIFEEPKGKELVNSLEKRLEILERLGAEVVVVEAFDEEFRHTRANDFVVKYLNDRYNAEMVFAGENYRYGYMAEGDCKTLAEQCKASGIGVEIIPFLRLDEVVSSSKIREYIKDGQLEKATEYMSRPYSVDGVVIHGRRIGRSIGFPTANISITKGRLLPKDGVYLTRVTLDNDIFYGITNVGEKPTVVEKERNIETHIVDFEGIIYDKRIEIEFLRRIRDIKKFNNLESLKAQLEKDKKEIVKML